MKKNSQKYKENHSELASQNILAELGKLTAGSYYDHQEVRISEFNRIRDIVYRKWEGINLTEVQKKKPKEEKYLKKFEDRHILEYVRILKEDKKLSNEEADYLDKVIEVQKNAEKFEQMYKGLMMDYVESQKVYKVFLEKIKGISAILSANLLKEFGYCENAIHISSLWKYCGMHVVEGQAPVRKKGEKLEFNARLRTLVWKISDSFVKQRTPFYREIYDKEKRHQVKMLDEFTESLDKKRKKEFDKINKRDEKRKYVSEFNPKAPVSLMNADLRARRKTIKIFLAHYWQVCKELNEPPSGRKPPNNSEPIKLSKPLRNSEPYVKSKMGHKHISNWKEAVEKNEQAKLKGKKISKDKVKATCR